MIKIDWRTIAKHHRFEMRTNISIWLPRFTTQQKTVVGENAISISWETAEGNLLYLLSKARKDSGQYDRIGKEPSKTQDWNDQTLAVYVAPRISRISNKLLKIHIFAPCILLEAKAQKVRMSNQYWQRSLHSNLRSNKIVKEKRQYSDMNSLAKRRKNQFLSMRISPRSLMEISRKKLRVRAKPLQ